MRQRGENVELLCAHNHKPPFVLPDWASIQSGEWGWMRRCQDFEEGAEVEARRAKRADAIRTSEIKAGQAAWRAQASIEQPPPP